MNIHSPSPENSEIPAQVASVDLGERISRSIVPGGLYLSALAQSAIGYNAWREGDTATATFAAIAAVGSVVVGTIWSKIDKPAAS